MSDHLRSRRSSPMKCCALAGRTGCRRLRSGFPSRCIQGCLPTGSTRNGCEGTDEEVADAASGMVCGLHRHNPGLVATQIGRVVPERQNARRVLLRLPEILRVVFTEIFGGTGVNGPMEKRVPVRGRSEPWAG